MFTPIISVVGHVDVGKTSFLDYFSTNKTKEVNNITQEIRLSEYFAKDINEKFVVESFQKNFNLDGVVFIDTPGHDYFKSQREVTTKLSHIAILIIDVVHGINQTHIEILQYFKKNKIDFIIILNKIDTIFEWKPSKDSYLKQSFQQQNKIVIKRLQDYMNNIICQLAEQEINAAPYYSNSDYKTFTSIVPLSAKTGEGMMDVMILLSKLMTKKFTQLSKNNTYNNINGYIIDLVGGVFGKGYTYIHTNNNIFKTGDTINIYNKQVATIKHILKNNVKVNEINTHGTYTLILDKLNYDCGDICIIDLKTDNLNFPSLTDCNLLTMDSVAEDYDDGDKVVVQEEDFELSKNGIGIITISKSMEKPLVYMFKQMNVPISLISNEHLSKNQIIKVCNNNKTKDKLTNIKYENYRVIAIFDPSYSSNDDKIITDEIRDFAKKNNVTLLFDQTIYKLKSKYENHMKSISEKIKLEYGYMSYVNLEILPQFIFLKTSPLLFGVKVKKGVLKNGTILTAIKDNKSVILGKVVSIHYEKEIREKAESGEQVCIKVDAIDKKIVYKTDFDETYQVQTYLSKDDMKVYELFKKDIESK
jgi:translation initiation factor 5B